jgi:hypothetical protein
VVAVTVAENVTAWFTVDGAVPEATEMEVAEAPTVCV